MSCFSSFAAVDSSSVMRAVMLLMPGFFARARKAETRVRRDTGTASEQRRNGGVQGSGVREQCYMYVDVVPDQQRAESRSNPHANNNLSRLDYNNLVYLRQAMDASRRQRRRHDPHDPKIRRSARGTQQASKRLRVAPLLYMLYPHPRHPRRREREASPRTYITQTRASTTSRATHLCRTSKTGRAKTPQKNESHNTSTTRM